MKKVLSFVLALVMVLALSVTAFAANHTYTDVTTPKTNDVEVTAGYTAGSDTEGATTYKFTVNWEASDTSLKYVGEKAEYVWDASNPTNLHYNRNVTNPGAGWSGSYVLDVKVTNYSNAALSLKTTATATEDLFDITNTGAEALTVANAAVDKNNGDAVINWKDTTTTGSEQTATVKCTFTPKTGAKAPSNASGDSITVGNVNITVDKVTPVAP